MSEHDAHRMSSTFAKFANSLDIPAIDPQAPLKLKHSVYLPLMHSWRLN